MVVLANSNPSGDPSLKRAGLAQREAWIGFKPNTLKPTTPA